MDEQLDMFLPAPPPAKQAAQVWVDAIFTARSENAQARRVGERTGHQWCHLWSEDVERLHALAARIGMKRGWFQNRPGFPHYDLTPNKRAAALRAGAVECDLGEWLRKRREGGAD